MRLPVTKSHNALVLPQGGLSAANQTSAAELYCFSVSQRGKLCQIWLAIQVGNDASGCSNVHVCDGAARRETPDWLQTAPCCKNSASVDCFFESLGAKNLIKSIFLQT